MDIRTATTFLRDQAPNMYEVCALLAADQTEAAKDKAKAIISLVEMSLIWTETKAGERWESEGYVILREERLHATLEEAIEDHERVSFTWKAPGWLWRDCRTVPSLVEAMKGANEHSIALVDEAQSKAAGK